VAAGHHNLDHSCPRLAFNLDRSQLLLHVFHVLLHLLCLLHEIAQAAFHHFLASAIE
jgi:hypothetical protein